MSDMQIHGLPFEEWFGHASWLQEKYGAKCDGRWPTLKAAINLYLQAGGGRIVETGCVRQAEDYGAGYSTAIFGDMLMRMRGVAGLKPSRLDTVDNNEAHLKTCRELTAPYAEAITYHHSDSVGFLRNMTGPPVQLLYLDSWDYPYGAMLDVYGGRDNLEAAIKRLATRSLPEIVAEFGTLIDPAQQHCLKEFMASIHNLAADGVVLIDDNNFPGGGKSRLARAALVAEGFRCVMDYQQTLWLR